MREEKKERHHDSHHSQPQQLQPRHHSQPQQQQSRHHSQQQQSRHHSQPQQLQQSHHQPPQYGTFQGVPHHSTQPAIGFPQPAPPPGATAHHPSQYYAHGYQAVPGHAVAEETPVRQRQSRLPCCGLGCGWCLFIIGFFLAAIPWYIAAFVLLCGKIDSREKPGYIACAVAAVLATIAVVLGLTLD